MTYLCIVYKLPKPIIKFFLSLKFKIKKKKRTDLQRNTIKLFIHYCSCRTITVFPFPSTHFYDRAWHVKQIVSSSNSFAFIFSSRLLASSPSTTFLKRAFFGDTDDTMINTMNAKLFLVCRYRHRHISIMKSLSNLTNS